jgi:tetratricopeptide (TPR) repeat protein
MAVEALDWFAIRAGTPPDAAIVERYRAAVSARASAVEAAGRTGVALRIWEGLAEDLAGTPAAVAAAAHAKRLGEPARRDLQRVRKQVDSDLAWIENANDRIAALAREEMPALPRLLREFDVDGLRKQASSADAVMAHSAQRRLALVAANAAFYIPELLKARGQLASAARWFELAIAIDPDAPGPHLGLARVRARTGNRKAAIEALRSAVSRGLAIPRERLAGDAELAALAGDPAFEEILRSLPAR